MIRPSNEIIVASFFCRRIELYIRLNVMLRVLWLVLVFQQFHFLLL